MKRTRWFVILYGAAALALFLYSFTQIDANMTISRFGLLQVVQQGFQWIGMSMRPLSTFFYVTILGLLFILYGLGLRKAQTGELTEKGLWHIIGSMSLILLLSYPAFSYDMFNYMFTAKTVLVYHQNPYEVIPLQFSGIDPWTNFMRWTHLPSAYTPFWILLTLPAYLAGFGLLLPVLWSIKAVVLLFHLATVVGIGKILEKVEPKAKTLGMAIFALNPLIIIEDLVSSHNDVVMMAFAVWAIYFFIKGSDLKVFQGLTPKLVSWFFLSLSVASKLITAAIIPIWFFIGKKRVEWRNWLLIFMVGALLAVISTREVLPWYWVWIVPFVALVPSNTKITTLSTGISLGLLLRYAPYLYLGNWDYPALIWKNVGTFVPSVVSVLYILLLRMNTKVIK